MKKWDVVILQYPFTDLSAKKVRPALVISPNSERRGHDAVFIAITSKTEDPGRFDLRIFAADPDFPATGLRAASAIKIDKIFTLEKSLVRATIGWLAPAWQAKVNDLLRRFFDLPAG